MLQPIICYLHVYMSLNLNFDLKFSLVLYQRGIERSKGIYRLRSKQNI